MQEGVISESAGVAEGSQSFNSRASQPIVTAHRSTARVPVSMGLACASASAGGGATTRECDPDCVAIEVS